MGSQRVISLQDIKEANRPLVGQKASGLAAMIRAGLNVPPGFCISAQAYREHLASCGLGPVMENLLSEINQASREEKLSILRALRSTIISEPLTKELQAEVKRHLRASNAPVAIRSSSTAEDLPGHSFAGQYDSYLGITNLVGCLEAVARCWASIWSERAFDYRERNGLGHLRLEMAVIVQELVAAEVSGVLFTVDPVGGHGNSMIVESVFGLGETLVSGKTAPDRFVLNGDSLVVISKHISEKRIESIVQPGGSVAERHLEPPRSTQQSIDESEARRLAEAGKEVAAAFGGPQDVEWSIRNGIIYLLQSRPISALPTGKSWEDRQVWSNLNAGEVLPDVVTPASWSLAQALIFKIFSSIFGRLGMDFGDNPLIGQVAGRAYFNLNTLTGAMCRVPGMRKMDIGVALGEAEDLKKVSIPEEDIPDLHFSLTRAILKIPAFIAWFYSNSFMNGERFLAELEGRLDGVRCLELACLRDAELLEKMHYVLDGLSETDSLIGIAARGIYEFMTLDKICHKWLDGREGINANQLCSGMAGMDSAEAGLELWKLALFIHESPELERAVLSGDDFETCREKMSETKSGKDFLAAWEAFMKRHGHHARGELEIFNARWSEDPDGVLEMVRAYLEGMEAIDPVANLRDNAHERRRMTRRCRELLKNPVKRGLFDYYLNQAQRGLVLRENMKSEAVRCMAFIRFELLELGKRLAERGITDAEDDIFFLDIAEMESVFRDGPAPDIKEVIAARRLDYERNMLITPPKIVCGRFDPGNFEPDEVDLNRKVLRGLAVSPGVVTGPARVMLRSDNGRVLPGEILVAPFTDPGWTPHFLTAAGIIMDLGGLLSHGSIVAREYGIPTVVNVGPATRIIKTGQRIEVDGTNGIVRIYH